MDHLLRNKWIERVLSNFDRYAETAIDEKQEPLACHVLNVKIVDPVIDGIGGVAEVHDNKLYMRALFTVDAIRRFEVLEAMSSCAEFTDLRTSLLTLTRYHIMTEVPEKIEESDIAICVDDFAMNVYRVSPGVRRVPLNRAIDHPTVIEDLRRMWRAKYAPDDPDTCYSEDQSQYSSEAGALSQLLEVMDSSLNSQEASTSFEDELEDDHATNSPANPGPAECRLPFKAIFELGSEGFSDPDIDTVEALQNVVNTVKTILIMTRNFPELVEDTVYMHLQDFQGMSVEELPTNQAELDHKGVLDFAECDIPDAEMEKLNALEEWKLGYIPPSTLPAAISSSNEVISFVTEPSNDGQDLEGPEDMMEQQVHDYITQRRSKRKLFFEQTVGSPCKVARSSEGTEDDIIELRIADAPAGTHEEEACEKVPEGHSPEQDVKAASGEEEGTEEDITAVGEAEVLSGINHEDKKLTEKDSTEQDGVQASNGEEGTKDDIMKVQRAEAISGSHQEEASEKIPEKDSSEHQDVIESSNEEVDTVHRKTTFKEVGADGKSPRGNENYSHDERMVLRDSYLSPCKVARSSEGTEDDIIELRIADAPAGTYEEDACEKVPEGHSPEQDVKVASGEEEGSEEDITAVGEAEVSPGINHEDKKLTEKDSTKQDVIQASNGEEGTKDDIMKVQRAEAIPGSHQEEASEKIPEKDSSEHQDVIESSNEEVDTVHGKTTFKEVGADGKSPRRNENYSHDERMVLRDSYSPVRVPWDGDESQTHSHEQSFVSNADSNDTLLVISCEVQSRDADEEQQEDNIELEDSVVILCQSPESSSNNATGTQDGDAQLETKEASPTPYQKSGPSSAATCRTENAQGSSEQLHASATCSKHVSVDAELSNTVCGMETDDQTSKIRFKLLPGDTVSSTVSIEAAEPSQDQDQLLLASTSGTGKPESKMALNTAHQIETSESKGEVKGCDPITCLHSPTIFGSIPTPVHSLTSHQPPKRHQGADKSSNCTEGSISSGVDHDDPASQLTKVKIEECTMEWCASYLESLSRVQ